MNYQQVWKEWQSKTHEPQHPRHLREPRWAELVKVINKYNVKTVLEFGSGISTILFSKMGLKVSSYETDADYLAYVMSYNLPNVIFHLHDNIDIDVSGNFDLALVDGILPRTNQLKASLEHAKIVAIDDFGPKFKLPLLPDVAHFERLTPRTSLMAIFKII